MTLLEVLAVLAILGILLAIAAPNFFNYRRAVEFRDAVQSVSQQLSLAESRSLRRNIAHQLTFTVGTAGKGRMSLAPTNDPTDVQVIELPAPIFISAVKEGTTDLSPARVVFNGRGRPNGLTKPVDVTVTSGTRVRVVRLLPSGKVTLP